MLDIICYKYDNHHCDYTIVLIKPLTHRRWKEVYHLAAEQGVMAMAFDSLADMPKEILPPRDILLSWGLTVDKVEKRYQRQSEVAQQLSNQLEQEQVSAIVMKGFFIGRYRYLWWSR